MGHDPTAIYYPWSQLALSFFTNLQRNRQSLRLSVASDVIEWMHPKSKKVESRQNAQKSFRKTKSLALFERVRDHGISEQGTLV